MEHIQIDPHVRHLSVNARLNTPRISISLEYPDYFKGQIVPDSDEGIVITFHRDHDGYDELCIFQWFSRADAFGPGGLRLLRHTPNGAIEEVELPPDTEEIDLSPSETIEDDLELGPGDSDWTYVVIPDYYRAAMTPGEKYSLVWPGKKISRWRWGTLKEHHNESWDLSSSPLTISGGPSVSFDAVAERPTERATSPPSIDPSERIPGTPILSTTVTGPSHEPVNGRFMISQKVTYHGVLSTDGEIEKTRPIIFRTYALVVEGGRLHRRCDDGEWQACDIDEDCGIGGWNPVEPEDVELVDISESNQFVSLQPGGSCTVVTASWSEMIPSDRVVGDVFRYQHKGGMIDWWAWGSAEDHADTVVRISVGPEFDPPSQEPKLMVPASNLLDITIVE
ncbi:hypothetical protein BDV23DRAFT_97761 [Aspergillus alliaceus]|uniref:Uncharacterized protein n=1 Tax=Petromyces alliaceus TaxID=209559 RepID=A0A5N7C5R7_PETAA|nr:hypothetical protein BDV23DRAFT_97761 [Aspergillus alliaceus]